MQKSWALLVLVVLGGCDLYFGGDDDPPPCNDYGYGAGPAIYPSQELRNPDNGQCQYVGGGYPCDDICGPCPAAGDDISIANPDWGSCYSQCEGLPEASCLSTAGCFAAYTDNPAADYPNGDGLNEFYGCWQTAPSGPVHGSCSGLDAQECSRHDDCSAVYASLTMEATYLKFESCQPEHVVGGDCSLVDCAMGYHCEDHCYGDPNTNTMDVCQAYCVQDLTCASVDCGPGYECAEVCDDGTTMSTCHPTCVPASSCETLTTETQCTNRSDCTPVYIGMDCTCTIYGCTCQNLTYDRCETL